MGSTGLRRCTAVALWLLLAGGCAACDETVTPPDQAAPDLAVPDAGMPDLSPDLPPPDAGGPDLRRDTWMEASCGGSRTLKPVEVLGRDGGVPCGKACRQVTFGAHASLHYEVEGDLLVYPGEKSNTHTEAVYMVDLKADREWLVQRRWSNRPGCFWVATDGKRLAYSCIISPDPQSWNATIPLTIYDPATKVEQDLQCLKLTKDKGRMIECIALGSTGVSMLATKRIDLYFHRFSDNSFTDLTPGIPTSLHAHMSGARIVSTEPVGQSTQIVLYDTIKNTRKLLQPKTKQQFFARIQGDHVVWVDHRHAPGNLFNWSDSEIYWHDLKTGKTVRVTKHPARQAFPDVWGDWVVYEDWRTNPDPTPNSTSAMHQADIWATNVKTGKSVQVTNLKKMELRPRIDNGRVFFRWSTSKGLRIFMVDLKKLGY